MTSARIEKLKNALNKRQSNLTLVLENVLDPHNISAVMRTCESVGMQDIFVLNTKIPPHKKFGKRSSSSAIKWLTVHQYDNTEECIVALRKKNLRIYTTLLGEGSIDLYAMDFIHPLAIVFGNEHSGISDEIKALADGNMMVPQVGIIQSLNISVACAVTVYEAFRQKRLAGHYEKQSLPHLQYDNLWKLWSENK